MNLWTTFLPLIGLVVGAVLQYWFSRAAESRRQLQLLQSQCYVDYLKAVTRAAHSATPEAARLAMADAADAKARLAIYGSSRVIIALARFEKVGPVLDNPSSLDAFIALVAAMRADDKFIDPSDLKLILFHQ